MVDHAVEIQVEALGLCTAALQALGCGDAVTVVTEVLADAVEALQRGTAQRWLGAEFPVVEDRVHLLPELQLVRAVEPFIRRADGGIGNHAQQQHEQGDEDGAADHDPALRRLGSSSRFRESRRRSTSVSSGRLKSASEKPSSARRRRRSRFRSPLFRRPQ